MKISKSIKEYRKLNKKQLKDKITDFMSIIMQNYFKGKKENRSRLRREVAKMKTVLNEQSYKDKEVNENG